MTLERAKQPSGIDADHDDEEREGQQQVHRLQHLDDPARWTTVEVVDVQHDPPVRRVGDELASQALEIAPHDGDESELAAVVGAACTLQYEVVEALSAVDFGEPLLDLDHPSVGSQPLLSDVRRFDTSLAECAVHRGQRSSDATDNPSKPRAEDHDDHAPNRDEGVPDRVVRECEHREHDEGDDDDSRHRHRKRVTRLPTVRAEQLRVEHLSRSAGTVRLRRPAR